MGLLAKMADRDSDFLTLEIPCFGSRLIQFVNSTLQLNALDFSLSVELPDSFPPTET